MSDCPDTLELRAFAEDPQGALAGHVEGCARCARLVDLARREEAAIRAALPVTPPADLLEKTLAAVGAEAPRRRRRRPARATVPWVGVAVGAALIVALLGALILVLGEGEPQPVDDEPGRVVADGDPGEVPPPAEGSDPQSDSLGELGDLGGENDESPDDDASDPSEDSLDGPASEVSTAKDAKDAKEDKDAEDAEDDGDGTEDPSEKDPESGSPDGPKEPESSTGPAPLAVLASGKLTADRDALDPGAPVPAGLALRAGSRGAELHLTGAARIWLAPRARGTLETRAGRRVLRLERGEAFARTQGDEPYAVATADAVVTPIGTEFLVGRKSSTTVRTFEGQALVRSGGADLRVRAGFAVKVREGRAAPQPLPATGPAPSWLRVASPANPPRFEVLQAFGFEGGAEGFQRGEHVAGGARGSRGALRGVRRDDVYAVYVELARPEGRGVLTLDPDLWVEVTCKVSERARVVVQLWDADAGENLALFRTIEPGRWVTLSAPLRAFGDASGNPRAEAPKAGNRCTSFDVFAGEEGADLDLRVDDVRFTRPR